MASKRHQRRRSCERKKSYETKEHALAAAAGLRRAFFGGTWSAYKCSFCGCWHVGRQSSRDIQAMRARRAAEAE